MIAGNPMQEALRTAIGHIDHMAAWITATNAKAKQSSEVYSFESLGEDMPGLQAALRTGQPTALDVVAPPIDSGTREALENGPHYLGAIKQRLERLYEEHPNEPRLREHLSDEVDWIDGLIAALAAPGATTTSDDDASLECDAVDRVAQAIRDYCFSIAPLTIQLSHRVERIYYAGLPVLELSRAILAAIRSGGQR